MTFDPSMHYTLVWGSFCQIWWPQAKEFDLWLTLADPYMTSDPAMSYTLIKGSSYQIWWPYSISKQFDPWLTLDDPCLTFDPSNALHSGQRFFPPNLVSIGHCKANWPLLDPSWPLHDLRPQQCSTFWSGVLSTKFGGHRALLSKLTPSWPQLTPTWP